MPHQAVATIKTLRIDAVQLPHALGQMAIDRFHDQVIMVGHLAIRMHHPVEAGADMPQDFQPCRSVLIIQIDVLAPVSSRSHMIEGARKFPS